MTAIIAMVIKKELGQRELARQLSENGLKITHSAISHIVNKKKQLPQAMWHLFRTYATKKRGKLPRDINAKIRIFDTTWLSFSRKLVSWAMKGYGDAENRSFVKLLLKLDIGREVRVDIYVTWNREACSDNSLFQEAVEDSEAGTINIFDKGFNKLERLKRLDETGRFFITPLYQYKTRLIKRLGVPPEARKVGVVDDSIFIVGAEDNKGRMRARVITLVIRTRKGYDTLRLMTNIMDMPAKDIVALYHLRWCIEVLFRTLKSRDYLRMERPFAMSAQGLLVSILAVVVSLLVIADCDENFDFLRPSIADVVSAMRVWAWEIIRDLFPHVFRPPP